jgi:hypothetical protein
MRSLPKGGWFRSLLLALIAWTVPSPLLAFQTFTTERHPELGLSFLRSTNYEALPVQPDEEFVALHFVDKEAVATRERRVRSVFKVIWIDHVPDPPPPEEQPPPPPPEKREGETGTRVEEVKPKVVKPPPPINSFERWVKQRFASWKIASEKDGFKRPGYVTRELVLAAKPAIGGSFELMSAWAYTISNDEHTIAFLGLADKVAFEKELKGWRRAVEQATVTQPAKEDLVNLQKRYAGSGLLGVDFRIAIRQKLVRGWKAEDTEHFIVLHNSSDKSFVGKVCRDLELLRKEYEKLFPAKEAIEAVSAVRICRNQAEYLLYCGWLGTAGYWNSLSEELVLYDTREPGNAKSDADTWIALYHEAFHQYIYYSSGEVPPHSWFNEGHGDFFSGAAIAHGKVNGIAPNSWRLETIRNAVRGEYFTPFEKMIRFERNEYYNPYSVGLNYAQGWAMVYFLRTAPEVRNRPEWARILPLYFETLKVAYAEELAKLGPEALVEPGPDAKIAEKVARMELRWKAGEPAREKAVATAFQGVDLAELEEAWGRFILAIPPVSDPK